MLNDKIIIRNAENKIDKMEKDSNSVKDTFKIYLSKKVSENCISECFYVINKLMSTIWE